MLTLRVNLTSVVPLSGFLASGPLSPSTRSHCKLMRVRAGLGLQDDGSDLSRSWPSCRNYLDAQESSHVDNESRPSARAAFAGPIPSRVPLTRRTSRWR